MQLRLCANQPLHGMLKVEDDHGTLAATPVHMQTLGRLDLTLPAPPDERSLRVWLDSVLIYDSGGEQHRLKRPLAIAEGYDYESVEGVYLQAREWERQRFPSRALPCYVACLLADPWHLRALVGMARLKQRHMEYEDSLGFLSKALSIDTYDGEANYLYGLAHARLGNIYDAKDGFSVAGQDPAYRSAAMTELARTSMQQGQHARALEYVAAALAGNPGNCGALRLQVVALIRLGRTAEARDLAAGRLLADPLDHVLRYASGMRSGICITSEWPHQTWLEIAAFYAGIEEWKEASESLQQSPEHPMVELWKAWIYFKTSGNVDAVALEKVQQMSPEGVFPHRQEELTILRWAVTHSEGWKLKYFLSLGLIQLMQEEEARVLLTSCGDEPGWYPFYLVRSGISGDGGADLLKAVDIAPDAWRPALRLSKHYAEKQQWGRPWVRRRKDISGIPATTILVFGWRTAICTTDNTRRPSD
ncbi:tetratricopeptide repeat protein [Puia sp. P3]|uniref:tetratricopeptide repeat protein n=1 Tax=Puia sp. P3 TaxID=3423952 RepID=UPI003D668F51